jgi:hypothetical protein
MGRWWREFPEEGRMKKEDKTLSDEIAFVEAVLQGLRDVDEGRVVPIEEVRIRFGLQ